MRVPAHSVCTAIRDDIVSGAHPPGSRLTEELLARRYGVSRVPVREALRTLESEGFVVTRRHAGACVAEPTAREAATSWRCGRCWSRWARHAPPSAAPRPTSRCCGPGPAGQERARRGEAEDLRALGGWFHETLARRPAAPASSRCSPSSGTRPPGCTRSSSRPARPTPGPSSRDRGRGGTRRRGPGEGAQRPARRARRRFHRLRRPDLPGRRTPPAARVRSSQHGVNTAGARP